MPEIFVWAFCAAARSISVTRRNAAPYPPAGSVGHSSWDKTLPSLSIIPTAILVPPISTPAIKAVSCSWRGRFQLLPYKELSPLANLTRCHTQRCFIKKPVSFGRNYLRWTTFLKRFILQQLFISETQEPLYEVPILANRGCSPDRCKFFCRSRFALQADRTADSGAGMLDDERSVAGRVEALQPERTRSVACRHHALERGAPHPYWLRRRQI